MIQISNVTKVHKRGQMQVRALRGISCAIPAGSFNFILGPSGSGKSTLLYLIGALDEPTSGEITVEGQQLFHMPSRKRDAYRRSQIGFVFQNFNLLSNLNAIDNVLVPYMPVGVTPPLRERAIELLKQVGLGDRLDHRPNQLSGGEQQRIAIARALLKRPSLVLADEPTGELDTENGAEVFRYLRQLQDDYQTTVIVVTHDQNHLTNSDRVLRLRDGQLFHGE